MKVVTKPVEMLALFDIEGCPNPLRFRMANEDRSFAVIRVDRILYRNMEKFAGNNIMVFRCQSNIDGMERVYELKYELRTCRWILFKI